MIQIKDAVIWTNHDTMEVMVRPHQWGCPEDRTGFHRGSWCDPIGAAISQWDAMNNKQRLHLDAEDGHRFNDAGLLQWRTCCAPSPRYRNFAHSDQRAPPCVAP